MANQILGSIEWYQKKLGSYDQQSWEKSIEDRVFNMKGLSHARPKGVARIKTELIDLDLIRGSAFTKAKPQQGCIATTYLGIIRVILYPFYMKWWSDQTSHLICSLLLALWTLQISSMYIYFNYSALTSQPLHEPTVVNSSKVNETSFVKPSPQPNDHNTGLEEIPESEVLVPLIMFLILSVIQSHIAASHSLDERNRRDHRDCVRARSRSQNVDEASDAPRRNSLSSRTSNSATRRNSISSCRKRSRKSPQKRFKEVRIQDDRDQQVPDKKPSDEESGLESLKSFNPMKPRPMRKLSDGVKGVEFIAVAEVPSNEEKSSSPIDGSPVKIPPTPTATTRSENSSPEASIENVPATGDEGDHEGDDDDAHVDDLSSPDEMSPYSTVNSVDNSNWKSYSGIVSSHIRAMNNSSHSRRQRSKSGPKLHIPEATNSSCDSEESNSPTTPNKGTNTDMEWPMVNSEPSSEDDEEEELATISTNMASPSPGAAIFRTEGTSSSGLGDNDNLLYNRAATSPPFYYPDDPDSLPPTIFSFCDEWMVGSKAEDKKNNDKVSCAIWQQSECQKVDLTVLDISSSIIRKVGKAKHSNEYFYLAVVFSLVLALIPGIYRLQSNGSNGGINGSDHRAFPVIFGPANDPSKDYSSMNILGENLLNFQNIPFPELTVILESMIAPSSSWLIRFIIIVAMVQRACLSLCFFFLLCVAERTYKERFMFSKYFCHLTSARRARRSDLPHFRLNKVRNIKTWLSVRSYLKKHGPQRSVDIIVSCGFILAVVILTFLCIQLLRESSCSSNLYCWEMVSWNLAIGIFIMRLIVLGSKMNRKYKGNLSVLITEQINLYLQLESKPHKKEELTLANHVLKLAADLLKQLEAPFKISGFSANHYLYNITKVVVLSAFSAVLTEMLGFKLKLHKIKL